MKIFLQQQIKKWDEITVERHYDDAYSLMDHAASCFAFEIANERQNTDYYIFCGPGNNGGDGLLIAHYLRAMSKNVHVYLLPSETYTADNLQAQERAKETCNITVMNDITTVSEMKEGIIIDALYGSGLNKDIQGFTAEIISALNTLPLIKISIDVPSGLMTDRMSNGVVFKADLTLTIQSPKLSFFFKESGDYLGEWRIVDIGLDNAYYENEHSEIEFIGISRVAKLLKLRKAFDHKGSHGHAALFCGGEGKVGAAVLSAYGCMRSGVGKLTCYLAKNNHPIMHNALPEAICADFDVDIQSLNTNNQAVGMGCGLGTGENMTKLIASVLASITQPLVLDADAINSIALAMNTSLLPSSCIITPHPTEFDRLFGKHHNTFARYDRQRSMSVRHNIYIVLKGKYTCITTPQGHTYFNSSGNPGMATAGSGDVLTGILTGLLAQGYSREDACIFGVYLHGLAGDIAASKFTQYAMKAMDIADNLGGAYRELLLHI